MGYLCRYLDTVGDGTGTKNAIGDYSVTPQVFMYAGSADLYRLVVSITDAGNFSADNYAGLLSPLTNGITVRMMNTNEVLCDLTDGDPIKSNAEWAKVCYDVNHQNFGTGNEFIQVRWTFTRAGQPLSCNEHNHFEIVLNDDFSGLVGHHFMIQGMT